MQDARYTAVPNVPPLGLRGAEAQCVVCARELAEPDQRHALRVQLTAGGVELPLLVVGYACKPCRARRSAEVQQAHLLAAERYLHIDVRRMIDDG